MTTEFVIIYLLKGALIQGFSFLFYLLFRKYPFHNLNRLLLILGLLFSLIIPLTSHLEFSLLQPVYTDEAFEWIMIPIGSSEEIVGNAVRESVSYNSLGIWVIRIYMLISASLFSKSLVNVFSIYHLKNQLSYVKKKKIKYYKTTNSNPFSFMSSIFIPQKFYQTDAFKWIFTHEYEHVRQLHSADRLLMDFFVSLFWFNPFIHCIKKALIEIHEFQADEAVIKKFKDPIGYQELLFSFLMPEDNKGLVSHLNFSLIKRRIIMMTKHKNKKAPYLYLLALPFIGCILLAFSLLETRAVLIQLEESIAIPEMSIPGMPEIQGNEIPTALPLNLSDRVKIRSGYGMRENPFTKKKQRHTGIDFSAPKGTDVYATANGTVLRTGHHPNGKGIFVEIQHGIYETWYWHLSKSFVKIGDPIVKGQHIADVGNTGKSTAPHLHYSIKRNGNFVDPEPYFEKGTE